MNKEKGDDTLNKILAIRKKRQEELKEAIASKNPEAMLVDGHDDALAG